MAPTAEKGTAKMMIMVLVIDFVLMYSNMTIRNHRERKHHDQLLPNTLHGLILSAPRERISRRKRYLIAHQFLGFVDIAADVAAGDVHVHVTVQHPVFIAQHCRTAYHWIWANCASGTCVCPSILGTSTRARLLGSLR